MREKLTTSVLPCGVSVTCWPQSRCLPMSLPPPIRLPNVVSALCSNSQCLAAFSVYHTPLLTVSHLHHALPSLPTDIEGAIDWWLSAYLPAGALPPQRLQLVINAAYNSAEQEDTSAQAAQAVLATVPRAEAAVIRAELERIKLSAGGMVDGRLLAAYRTLFEAAASQQQQQQEEPAAGTAARLGRDWQQHMRLAVARRSRELLKEMPTPLLQDLEQLAAEDTEQQQAHCWADVLKSYAAAVAAFEAEHGSLLDCEENERDTSAAAAGSAGPDAATSSGSTISEPALPDAGVDAEFARLLLQHAASDATALAPAAEERAGVGSSCILPVTYRAYKKMILTDAVLLCVA